jgi:glycine/D-amino acid oxidase-like deaminating enzyme
VAVVGGGVTGLACALTLAQTGRRVRVLEAGRVGGGASGRNGGFALRGTAVAYDRCPDPELWRLTEDALVRLAALAGDAFRPVGSLRLAASEAELEAVHAEYETLRRDGLDSEWRARDELPPALRKVGLGALLHPGDGALEPGRWARRLAALAADAGAAIAEASPVVAVEETTVRTGAADVRAEAVVVATDGYTGELLPELGALLTIARNQVIATVPLDEMVTPCPVYARGGYDYWQQTPDGRLVLGGSRDVDEAAETTAEEGLSRPVQAALEDLLVRLLGELPTITHRWSGLLAFTPDRLPLVGELRGRPGLWVSLGYSGHGNVLALACGERLARTLLGDASVPPAFDPGRFGR